MKAIVYDRYGPPDVLRLEDVAKPVPADDDVLVRVHAASINSWDWDLVRGHPFLIRMWGLLKPKHRIPGGDIAGTVEAVGANVAGFEPGDEVFGDLSGCGWGGFAEYVLAPESALTLKPSGVSFEDAAALPQAAVMALQGLRDYGRIQAGEAVLINGAGGGFGTFAIQLAKHFGAEVTGVDSTGKLDIMRSAGADHVIDYTREDFVRNGKQYDLILDAAAHFSIFDYRKSLNLGGVYVMVGGKTGRIFQVMLLGPLLSKLGTRQLGVLGHKPNKNLALLGEYLENGTISPVIDRRYSLGDVPDAFRYFSTGWARGKLVIVIDHEG
ncbi:MAG: NAD(P)-dependent alcohol dehydrogenase [Thermomicrobiales bacterium]